MKIYIDNQNENFRKIVSVNSADEGLADNIDTILDSLIVSGVPLSYIQLYFLNKCKEWGLIEPF